MNSTMLTANLATELGGLCEELLAHFECLPRLVMAACNLVSGYPDKRLLVGILLHLRTARVTHILIFQGVFFDTIPRRFPSIVASLLASSSRGESRKTMRLFYTEVTTQRDRCDRAVRQLARVHQFWSRLSVALHNQADLQSRAESRAWFSLLRSTPTLSKTTRTCADAVDRVSGEVDSMSQTVVRLTEYWDRMTLQAEGPLTSGSLPADDVDRTAWSILSEGSLSSLAVTSRQGDAAAALRHGSPQMFEPHPLNAHYI
ncbi:hypothetical protein FRB95_012545 [Tulasnella sp. JGI-2019a]|nr:hypothetical protein FRB95_012545 [Tulasnella sp. JGI-2019a]